MVDEGRRRQRQLIGRDGTALVIEERALLPEDVADLADVHGTLVPRRRTRSQPDGILVATARRGRYKAAKPGRNLCVPLSLFLVLASPRVVVVAAIRRRSMR